MAKKLIALDAGHGSNTYPPDKGVPSMAEHTFNAAVVGYTKPLLEKSGFQILLTQPLNGLDVPLTTRTNNANSKKADLFLSFHADANNNKSARGHWAFYWHTSSAGKKLAGIWSEEMTKATGTKHRGNQASKRGSWTNFHVVRETNMPSVLMEHAFMTNAEDLELLKSDKFRRQCAEAAAKAVCRYFGVVYKGDTTKTEKPKDDNKGKDEVAKPPSKPKPQPTPSQPSGDAYIRDIQQWVVNCGYKIAVDGLKGPETKRGLVRVYQNELNKQFKAGLVVDGIPGAKTYNAARNVKKGAKGNLTRVLQALLYLAGFNPGPFDGHFGGGTEAAVRDFQRAKKLTIDGVAGKATWTALLKN